MDSVDCVVVGAGVVGLAVARAFAQAGREVLVLERERQIGTGISSRGSEVIHAGIYYPVGSLKARLCAAGRKALYTFCAEHGVAAVRCGKLIVATSDREASKLDEIATGAARNGVDDLRKLTGAEARSLEPELTCAAALLSPSTGIVDSHAFMLALQGDAEGAGAVIAASAPFVDAKRMDRGLAVRVGGADPMALRCRTLVNCAGLDAPAVASCIDGLAARHIAKAYLAKGSYFTLAGRAPFKRLIYPVPVPGGLGVHLTLDLAGQARFGPDVEWVDALDYDVDPARAPAFYAAIRRYWPGLCDGALRPAYAGIRPKIVPPGAPAHDFVVQGEDVHGVPGLVNLFGIESPGLTAALALAGHTLEVSRLHAWPGRTV